MAFESSILKEVPDILTSEERKRMRSVYAMDTPSKMELYEGMMARYSHPFFMVRLAELFALMNAGSLALGIYRRAQDILTQLNIEDGVLNDTVQVLTIQVDSQAKQNLEASQQRAYYQVWKETRLHVFPTNLPQLPPSHQQIKDQWQALTTTGSSFSERYLKRLAIETNQLEGTFLLTDSSMHDIVRNDISEGAVNYLPQSSIQDSAKINSILTDTLAAYSLMDKLLDNPQMLNKDTICTIHASLMETRRFVTDQYAAVGVTRTTTQKTVIAAGAYNIECCPFLKVDEELEYICRMAKQWINTWRNPFATASWIHLVLVRCHPFDDGNGQLVRLIASLPLVRNGYPPISVMMTQREEYYTAINKAYDGDYNALVQCILKGLHGTITAVRADS